MLNLVEKVKQKLDEYDIPIFDQYENERNEYIITAENMILSIKNKNSIGVSFYVATKPEISASSMGILYETKEIKTIAIMESFAITKEKEIVSGDEAYELLKKTMKNNIIQDFETDNYYKMLLAATKGHEC